jgi:hypothetical protein
MAKDLQVKPIRPVSLAGFKVLKLHCKGVPGGYHAEGCTVSRNSPIPSANDDQLLHLLERGLVTASSQGTQE